MVALVQAMTRACMGGGGGGERRSYDDVDSARPRALCGRCTQAPTTLAGCAAGSTSASRA